MKYNIAVVPGDGIGHEIVPTGIEVLEELARTFNFSIVTETFPYGAGYYKENGNFMPEDGLDRLKNFDAGIDPIAPDRFLCICHVIRITGIPPGELITVEMLGPAAANIHPGEGILFHTGWSRRSGNIEMYRNHLPRISRELALWIKQKKVNLVGVEPPSVADVNNREELLDIHSILLGADILIVEGLINLDKIEADRVHLIVLPLKIKNADGSPMRAIAIEG
ncbi:MAG TPA: isocitrate/isopropylmalate family dehydrogenase [Bacteroidales bacterium]|nr:isocitrate/isopropylmalate family dehydrogenase [Bacteroidales bacterium]